MRWSVLLGSLLFCVPACSDDAGNDSAVVGGPCQSNDDCASDSQCERGGDFPDGLCTRSCNDIDDCPFGSSCVDEEGGICMLECGADSDCRGGYECKDEDREEGGKVLVCKE